MRVLAREYPHLVDGYERLFAAKYTPASYSDEVQRMVGLLKAKYGLTSRRHGVEANAPADAAAPPRQIPMRFVRARASA